MPRAIWSGDIAFGLVSVPVKLYPAVRSHGVSFRQVNRKTGNRVSQKRVDAQTGEEVPYQDIAKGYEIADGRYVILEPDELRDLAPEASRRIEILDFVELAEIDPVYYDAAYHLAPASAAAGKPYRLLAQAMDTSGRAAIASFVMRTREHLVTLRVRDGVLTANTMHYADELVPAATVEELARADVEVSDRELRMAEQLIGQLATSFEPEQYEDIYQRRVLELIGAKAAGDTIAVAEPERPEGEVVDLMAALERSLAAGRGTPAAPERAGIGDYATMSKAELYELAQRRDIDGRSSMSKDELVEALRATDEAERRLAS